MFIEKLSVDKLETRLDAGFYNPKYLKLNDRLSALGAVPLKNIVSKIACGPFGGNAIADDIYQENGLFFIRPVNISSNTFDDSSLVKVPEKVLREKGLKIYEGENLYFGRVGVPCVALIIGKTSISPNIIIAETKNITADPYYLSCFASSIYGLSQLKRQLKEVAQPTTSTEAVKGLLVYEPNIDAQTYIGNQVRQASLLIKWAKKLADKAKSNFESSIGWDPRTVEKVKFGRISADKLENRLDHRFNSIEKIKAIDLLKQNNIKLQELEDIYSITAMVGWKGLTTEHYVDDGPWLLRGVEFSNGVIDFDSLVMVDKEKYLEQPQIHLKEGDIAFSKDGTIGKAIVIPKIAKEFAVGSTIARLRNIDDTLNPYYLEHCLNHDFLQVQIESYATGVAQPHITQEWIAKLLIPRIANEQQISTLVSKHHLAMNLAKSLTNSSKKLVESLIEGQITEEKLIEAQLALDDGDNSIDRAILSKLTNKGYLAEDGNPLFADLDKLYELLDEAKVAMDVDGELV